MATPSYSFGKQVSMPFDEAVKKTTEALAAQGFGIPVMMDLQSIFKAKINKDIPPYKVLGACNPSLAAHAVEMEPQIGALLPCNVVVRQDAEGKVFVEAMDPEKVLTMVQQEGIADLAKGVREKLTKALDAI